MSSGEGNTFSEAWEKLQPRFPALCELCGGLATVFPNTATVESDFSILKWEKDDHRKSLTNLSLEGILQAKQWETIQKLHSELKNGIGG